MHGGFAWTAHRPPPPEDPTRPACSTACATSCVPATTPSAPRRPTSAGSSALSSSTASATRASSASAEINRFLTDLAVRCRVAASTQNQALSALLFLYEVVLQQPLPRIEDLVRARRPRTLPTVLSRGEVDALLASMDGAPRLVASLLYGAGLRLLEGLRLRVKDLDLGLDQIVVRDGKGFKDRVTMLPTALKPALTHHLEAVRAIHQADLAAGHRRGAAPRRPRPQVPRRRHDLGLAVRLPGRRAARRDPRTGSSSPTPPPRDRRCSAPSGRRRAPRGIDQPGELPHPPPLLRDPPPRGRLRHPHHPGAARARDVSTTMIYTHVLRRGGRGVRSPADTL